MNAEERNLIAGLFERVRSAENVYRDPEAEAFIADQIARQPHAPYAMAQTLVVQNQSLEAAKARIEQLERELAETHEAAPERRDEPSPWGPRASEAMGAPSGFGAGGGSFGGSGGLFGRQGYEPSQPYGAPPTQSYPQQAPGRGGGFLSGALQTAAGVAGGALLFEGVRHLFGGGGGEAQAHEGAKLADAGPSGGDSNTPGSDAASSEGGWFGGLLDGVGGAPADRSARADDGDPGGDRSDDDGGWA